MLFQHREQLTPAALVAEWLRDVEAPKKHEFWFENSAHKAMIEEPERSWPRGCNPIRNAFNRALTTSGHS